MEGLVVLLALIFLIVFVAKKAGWSRTQSARPQTREHWSQTAKPSDKQGNGKSQDIFSELSNFLSILFKNDSSRDNFKNADQHDDARISTSELIENMRISLTTKGGKQLTFASIIDGNQGIGIDSIEKKMVVIDKSGKLSVFNFKDITSVDVVEGNDTRQVFDLYEKQKESKYTHRPLLSKLLTEKSLKLTNISKLSLKIYTTDLGRPLKEIIFLNNQRKSELPVSFVQECAEELEQWLIRMNIILRKNSFD